MVIHWMIISVEAELYLHISKHSCNYERQYFHTIAAVYTPAGSQCSDEMTHLQRFSSPDMSLVLINMPRWRLQLGRNKCRVPSLGGILRSLTRLIVRPNSKWRVASLRTVNRIQANRRATASRVMKSWQSAQSRLSHGIMSTDDLFNVTERKDL